MINAAERKVVIDAVTLARSADNRTARIEGPAIVVRFGGQASAVIPAGAELWSDPVAFPVTAGGDVAVACSRPTLTRLLHTTGFDRIVPVTETVESAVAALDDAAASLDEQ